MEIKNIALIGAGAIGCVYGYSLHKAYKDNFCFVANGKRREKLEQEGLYLNGEKFTPRVISSDDDFKADLLILSVKNYQLADAIEDVRNLVDENTIILPLLNGIVATDILKQEFKSNNVLYGIAMKIDALKVGNKITNSCDAIIQFGEKDNTTMSEDVLAVKKVLDFANINNEIYDDMVKTVWNKWMINVSVNQVTAITKATYRIIRDTPEVLHLIKKAMKEVVAVSKAVGVNLDDSNIEKAIEVLLSMGTESKTSMFQDVENKRKTEVENFSGTLIKLAKENNVEVPINEVLYDIIKSIEKNY